MHEAAGGWPGPAEAGGRRRGFFFAEKRWEIRGPIYKNLGNR